MLREQMLEMLKEEHTRSGKAIIEVIDTLKEVFTTLHQRQLELMLQNIEYKQILKDNNLINKQEEAEKAKKEMFKILDMIFKNE